MAIKTRSAVESQIATDLADNTTGDITPDGHRGVAGDIADSAVFLGEAEVRVISMALTAPPGGEGDRDAYVVGSGATGDWAGEDDKIAIWDASLSPAGYVFITPVDGSAVWNLADDKQYRWDAGSSPAGWTEVVTGGGGSSNYDVPVVFGGTPAAGEVIGRYTGVRTIDFAANFSGSYGTVEVVPDATFEIDVEVNGSLIGTVSISTGGAFTFSTDGGTSKQWAAGQKLEFIAPADSPAESSIDGISFMLAGTEG